MRAPVEKLVICAAEGWFALQPDGGSWEAPRVEFTPERPAIHLEDLVIGSRVAGVRSYAEQHLKMQIFQRWRTSWLERGDLLLVQPEELALFSNQSAIPGEPEIRLLTLVHPGSQPEDMAGVRRTLERLQGTRRLFGMGWQDYRQAWLQELGVEPLPISARYRDSGDPLWWHVRRNYPEALLCLELHIGRDEPGAALHRRGRSPIRIDL